MPTAVAEPERIVSPIAVKRPYTLAEVSALLDTDSVKVRRWIKLGRVIAPSRSVGRKVFWDRDMFDQWIAGRETATQ